MKTKSKLILILTFYLTSPAFGQRTIFGLYGECQDHYMACQQLELKQDSTFEYGIFMDVGGWNILEGKWTMKGDTIILNTYKQFNPEKKKYYFDNSSDTIALIPPPHTYLTNDKWLIDGNKIYEYKPGSDTKPYYLTRTQLKKKAFKNKE